MIQYHLLLARHSYEDKYRAVIEIKELSRGMSKIGFGDDGILGAHKGELKYYYRQEPQERTHS